jgi:hypothetical protein
MQGPLVEPAFREQPSTHRSAPPNPNDFPHGFNPSFHPQFKVTLTRLSRVPGILLPFRVGAA